MDNDGKRNGNKKERRNGIEIMGDGKGNGRELGMDWIKIGRWDGGRRKRISWR